MAGFMRLEVWREMALDVNGDVYPESEVDSDLLPLARKVGARWFANYSAPGYMDRTETVGPYNSPLKAARECFGLYGDTETGSADRSELAQFIWGNRWRPCE
jgi:hypothetical protein